MSDPTLTSKKKEGSKKSDELPSFDNYASLIDDAVKSGEEWIWAANQDSSSTNHLKILSGGALFCCNNFY